MDVTKRYQNSAEGRVLNQHTTLEMEFNELSVELKFNILQYLHDRSLRKFSTVCKQWGEMCRAPRLRRILRFASSHVNSAVTHPLQVVIESLTKCYRVSAVSFRFYRSWSWLNQIPKRYFLHTLMFYDCDISSSETIEQLIKLFPAVQELHLTFCDTISDECLSRISRWKFLKVFKYTRCPSENENGIIYNVGITDIAKNCENLQHLIFDRNYAVTESSFRTLITLRGENLISLGVRCDDYTDDTYLSLTRCSNIRMLYLDGALKLTDSGLLAIAKLSQLETLHVKSGTILSDAGFINFFTAAEFSNLKDIDLTGCLLLGDHGITSMVKRFPNLKYINVTFCFGISPRGIQVIVDNSRNLKELFIQGLHLERTFLVAICKQLREAAAFVVH